MCSSDLNTPRIGNWILKMELPSLTVIGVYSYHYDSYHTGAVSGDFIVGPLPVTTQDNEDRDASRE